MASNVAFVFQAAGWRKGVSTACSGELSENASSSWPEPLTWSHPAAKEAGECPCSETTRPTKSHIT